MHLNCILPTRKFTILLWVQNSKFRSDWQQNVAHALPGPDYFDEEAKCYLGCLNFAKSHFAVPDSEVACFWQNINKLPSILPPRQNNPVAAVMMLDAAEGTAFQMRTDSLEQGGRRDVTNVGRRCLKPGRQTCGRVAV